MERCAFNSSFVGMFQNSRHVQGLKQIKSLVTKNYILNVKYLQYIAFHFA